MIKAVLITGAVGCDAARQLERDLGLGSPHSLRAQPQLGRM
jgi:hypothetical protein